MTDPAMNDAAGEIPTERAGLLRDAAKPATPRRANDLRLRLALSVVAGVALPGLAQADEPARNSSDALAPVAATVGGHQGDTSGATVSFSVGDDDRVRIEVPSSTDQYHVLFYRPKLDNASREYAVAILSGADGSVELSEPLRVKSGGAYRVATYSTNDPGDVDGDGTDDLAELGQQEASRRAPLNRALDLPIEQGAAAIPDMATFEALSYQGPYVGPEEHLRGLQYVKFTVSNFGEPNVAVHFQNTTTYRMHPEFLNAVHWWRDGEHDPWPRMRGEIVYHPNLIGPNGQVGTFRYQYQSGDRWLFHQVSKNHELISASMPFLRNNLVYHPTPSALRRYERQKAKYDASRVPVYLEEDLFGGSVFGVLNAAVGYGLLRVLGNGERPTFGDLVILRHLPNELSRVAGVISLERQTPLSHVNLRAIQDGVPNAYIGNALDDEAVAGLVGKYVRFEVSSDPEERFEWTDPGTGETVTRAGYKITESTAEEVAAHHEERRPDEAQTPARDLTVTTYRALADIAFADSAAFGVKASNLAVLRTLGLTGVEVPDGYALPFYYYDEFMKHNEIYDDVDTMLAVDGFETDIDTRDAEMRKLRESIRDGTLPEWMTTSLAALQALFEEATSIRCRSSTNNEDLPGFSGAGLYDSVTHHPAEGNLGKSVKQVFASLWSLRAFEERVFYRVDHKAAAMGVLLHPNFSDETVNGVAVSDDPVYGTEDAYYVNAQVGEDLVTNPSSAAVPEELLLSTDEEFQTTLVSRSNLVEDDVRVLSDAHIETLHAALGTIHDHFEGLYEVGEEDDFAMEIEFKVTAEDNLAIKQARPWVY